MMRRSLLLLCQLGLWSAPALATPTGPVAVFELNFQGEVPAPLRDLLNARLVAGLTASGMKVIHGAPVRRFNVARGSVCDDAACRRAAAGTLGCRYVLGGAVQGEDRFFKLELWIADGYTGAVLARTRQSCEICGQQAVGDKMDLSASALRAKLESFGKEVGRVSIITDPPGAEISVDGDVAGQAPLELELAPGTRRLRLRVEGYLPLTRTIEVVRGVHERVEAQLIPAGSPWRGRAGWILGGAGLAGLGTGIALFALDGGSAGCTSDLAGAECPSQRDTTAAAWTLTALGASSLILGSYLVLTAGRKEAAKTTSSPSPQRPRLSLTPMGAGVRLAGAF